jgi:hypothetical protein
MKLFISCSGERSKKVAELLDGWIKCVLPAVDPYLSFKGSDRTALWFSNTDDLFAGAGIAVVCLTHENKNKPWILFESGALAQVLSSNRVCTVLIDLASADLEDPLALFDHTKPTKNGIAQLVRTINDSTKELALSESVLEAVFEKYWPQFEAEFSKIIESTPSVEVKHKRKSTDVMLDDLERMLDKRIRSVETSGSARSILEKV